MFRGPEFESRYDLRVLKMTLFNIPIPLEHRQGDWKLKKDGRANSFGVLAVVSLALVPLA